MFSCFLRSIQCKHNVHLIISAWIWRIVIRNMNQNQLILRGSTQNVIIFWIYFGLIQFCLAVIACPSVWWNQIVVNFALILNWVTRSRMISDITSVISDKCEIMWVFGEIDMSAFLIKQFLHQLDQHEKIGRHISTMTLASNFFLDERKSVSLGRKWFYYG